MSFVRPELLWLAIALPLLSLAAVLGYARRRRNVALRLGDPELLRRLGGVDLTRPPRSRYALIGATALALGIAAAGPRWGLEEVEARSRSGDVVLALDVSRSMLARDVAPDRMERQRLAARRIIRELPGDRIGLVAFAGRAYVLTPPTADHSALELYLDALDPEIVSQGGSTISAALRQAVDLARGRQETAAERVVVLITDGEAHDEREEVLQAAGRARQLGVVVHTAGLGTTQGAPVPERFFEGGPVTGSVHGPDGEVVISRLDEELLREVAERGGGSYVSLSEPGGVGALVDRLRGLTREEQREGTRVRPKERYPWFVFIALALLGADAWAGRARRGARPEARP